VTEFENGMNRTEKCGTGASLLGVRIPPSPPISRSTNCSHYIFLLRPRAMPHSTPQKFLDLDQSSRLQGPDRNPVGSVSRRSRADAEIDRPNYKDTAAGEADDVITHMERQAAHSDQSRRCFAVGFRDSNVRIVFPEVDDPLGIGSRSSQGVGSF
jgi:hypothetical protein